jgi:hypothetical protein
MASLFSISIILFVVILSFCSTTTGLISFLIVRILVPEVARVNNSISLNTGIIFALIFVFLIKTLLLKQKIYINKRFFALIAAFILYSVITLPLSNYGSLSGQYEMLFQFIVTDLFPPLLFISFISNEEQLRMIIKAYMVIAYVVCIYGIFCYIVGSNPYVSFIKDLYSSTTAINGTSIASEAWYGKATSSTFIANNQFGYYLVFTISFLALLYHKCKDRLTSKDISKFVILFILLLICIVLSKKRTAVVAIVAFVIIWLVSGNIQKHLKLFLLLLIPIGGLLIVIFTVRAFSSIKNILLTSIFFWNDKYYSAVTNNNGGSNMVLRTRQVWYPFIEIKSNLLFGHGAEWCAWYTHEYTLHPILYGFETILASSICEFGILGYIIYFFIYFSLYKFSVSNTEDRRYEKIFFITVVIGAIGTGANYWYLFLILVVFIYKLGFIEPRTLYKLRTK